MKDVRGIEKTSLYKNTQNSFKAKFSDNTECEKVSKCEWKVFKDAFLEFTQYFCPMCETKLNNHTADIDHYRPKSEYEFLKCCCKNYLLMCADCNRSHKHTKFPLATDFVALNSDTLDGEEALLINPRYDNIFEYFEIAFINSKGGKKILILQPKLELESLQQDKAKETIELYGLGDCDKKGTTQNCRINLLNMHYLNFHKLAQKLDETLAELDEKYSNDTEKIQEEYEKVFQYELEKCSNDELLKQYGFLEFIRKGQFVFAVE